MNRLLATLGRHMTALVPDLTRERRCIACASAFIPAADAGEAGAFCCPSCALRLRRRPSGYCSLCGALAPWPQSPVVPCADCLTKRPPWTQGFFHSPYEDLLRALITRCKFHHHIALARHLGMLLASHPDLALCSADGIVPIPLHPSRLRHRGFNQSLELARPLARRLHAPLEPGLLVRTRRTAAQPGLLRPERFRNLIGAFAAPNPAALHRRHLLLVDDVMTTGATFSAAAQILLQAGAAQVSIAALGRTPAQEA